MLLPGNKTQKKPKTLFLSVKIPVFETDMAKEMVLIKDIND